MAEHPPSETILKAQSGLAAALGMDPGCVTIGTGDIPQEMLWLQNEYPERTHLLLMLHKTGSDVDQKGAEKELLAQFAAVPPLAAIACTHTDEQLACEMSEKIKGVIPGTDFNAKLLEWPGFNPDIVKKDNWWNRIEDYAVNRVESTPYGIEFSLHLPVKEGEDPKPLAEKVDANIKERLPAIRTRIIDDVKTALAENLRKEGKTPEEIACEIKTACKAMEKLQISINLSEDCRTEVKIALRSPEQAEAYQTALGGKIPDNADELRATNPLHKLSHNVTEDEPSPQLHRALAGGFLLGGEREKVMEIFPLIAGRNDMAKAMAKEIQRVIEGQPDKAEALKPLLASPLFKNYYGTLGSPDAALPLPIFKKDPKQADMMEVWIPLPKDKVKCTVEALAALAQQPSCPEPVEHAHAAPAAAAPPPMDVKPMLLELMQQMIIPAAGAPGNVVLQPQAAPSREASQPQVYTAG